MDEYLITHVGYEYRQQLEWAVEQKSTPAQLLVLRSRWCIQADELKAAELSCIECDLLGGNSVQESLWKTIKRQSDAARELAPLPVTDRPPHAHGIAPCFRGTRRCKRIHDPANTLHRVAMCAAQRFKKPGHSLPSLEKP